MPAHRVLRVSLLAAATLVGREVSAFTFPPQPLRSRRIQPARSVASSTGTEMTEDEMWKVPEHFLSEVDLFCNRELGLGSLEAVGFDMDYTLAQYHLEFDLLAYNGAKEKLVNWLGYPAEVMDFQYGTDIARRGCLIDRSRGNILKLDNHRYVRAVEHGLTALSREERKSVYRSSYQESESFTGKEFANIDTPFSLVDGCLFAQLVDIKDRLGDASELMAGKKYCDLYSDMRRCVDRCHKDGVIKLTVAENPEKYIVYDENLFPMLEEYRRAGKKVFLLTNSLWDYTQVVMNYLQGKKTGADKDFAWTEYFDLIIVGGNKPAFITNPSLPMYKVDRETGQLQNCDDLPSNPQQTEAFLARFGNTFQGGSAHILHQLLQISSGSNLLYVGDHIFADVVRSKATTGWRTCLIVPELYSEIQVFKRLQPQREQLMQLKRQQHLIEREVDTLFAAKSKLLRSDVSDVSADVTEITSEWAAKSHELHLLHVQIRSKLATYDMEFHPRWGQLFKANFQESRISKQIQDYACVYTSKASNLGNVSPFRTLRPQRDRMAHDFYLDMMQNKKTGM
ncbi:HAD-superfamily hydrolase [Ochromonadaceae sp. CCMP2298]|nr:HAD-superfamily hydrolase [Ochromonadaceae sp. CCMP2298]|eukprot:CAMPEP_0173343720 /NCGR_PEP_ID=MMETSP1144-20121109/10944_1 /TAXON_ID=483371 /ORGANISM="non described non described, Strain CCMP2298" /LENGTH=565 /DNA_ID=CAMNT_0014290505 /DNA_START=27 /DNA_END=1724 /DNA_ORIENTATION=+